MWGRVSVVAHKARVARGGTLQAKAALRAYLGLGGQAVSGAVISRFTGTNVSMAPGSGHAKVNMHACSHVLVPRHTGTHTRTSTWWCEQPGLQHK